jgi:glyoxylase-like metal-dependent hydrolase (beta-lactamase superfamily II)
MSSPSHLPVVPDWFSVTWVTGSIAMLTEPHVNGLMRANLWYMRGRERDLLVDTGNGAAPLRPVLARLTRGRSREVIAVATHAHVDHIGGLHEFERRLLHPREEEAALHISDLAPLSTVSWSAGLKAYLVECGLRVPPALTDARPAPDFDPVAFRIAPVTATHLVEGGDTIDLGERQFQVLHLPGHSPGSIGLWDEVAGVLFSGDVVYDGELLDALPGSNVEEYVRTMERLLDLPVTVVYPGHDEPFGRERLRELVRAYLRRHGE